MTSNELKNIMSEKLPNAKIFLTDATYLCPSREWVEEKLYFELFRGWTFDNGLTTWDEAFDCDNFASLFYTFAQICHAKTMKDRKTSETIQGLAIGKMFYMTRNGGGHAINLFVSKCELYFFEPQNGNILNLNEEERRSCWFVLC